MRAERKDRNVYAICFNYVVLLLVKDSRHYVSSETAALSSNNNAFLFSERTSRKNRAFLFKFN